MAPLPPTITYEQYMSELNRRINTFQETSTNRAELDALFQLRRDTMFINLHPEAADVIYREERLHPGHRLQGPAYTRDISVGTALASGLPPRFQLSLGERRIALEDARNLAANQGKLKPNEFDSENRYQQAQDAVLVASEGGALFNRMNIALTRRELDIERVASQAQAAALQRFISGGEIRSITAERVNERGEMVRDDDILEGIRNNGTRTPWQGSTDPANPHTYGISVSAHQYRPGNYCGRFGCVRLTRADGQTMTVDLYTSSLPVIVPELHKVPGLIPTPRGFGLAEPSRNDAFAAFRDSLVMDTGAGHPSTLPRLTGSKGPGGRGGNDGGSLSA